MHYNTKKNIGALNRPPILGLLSRVQHRSFGLIQPYRFLSSVIDTIVDHIAVINDAGVIEFVNQNWIQFGRSNDCLTVDSWEGVNYLDVCDKSASMGDELGRRAADGIRGLLRKEQRSFYLEYPCHGPDVKRWFMMRVSSFELDGHSYFVISHQDITERKLAEERVLNLSRTDGLTNIFNRRHFDDFLREEWKRCARLQVPISLVILDIDHFKLFNDTYGHQAGDNCLKRIAVALREFARRPGDMCARYGGEEFSIVYGNTDAKTCIEFAEEMLEAIRRLNVPNRESPVLPVVTASAGVATMLPEQGADETPLIQTADSMLYKAKKSGRNRVVAPSC